MLIVKKLVFIIYTIFCLGCRCGVDIYRLKEKIGGRGAVSFQTQIHAIAKLEEGRGTKNKFVLN